MTLSPEKTNWTELLNESVHTSDDVDIGDIEAISRDFVVVKRGFVNIHYYYIPISKVEGWDGNVLWLKIPEEEAKRNYERNAVPDPSRYYVREYPYYAASYYPPLNKLQPKYTRPAYPASPPEGAQVFKCDICGGSFGDEDKFSDHVKSSH